MLHKSQIDFFKTQGYLILKGFVETEQIAAWRRQFWAHVGADAQDPAIWPDNYVIDGTGRTPLMAAVEQGGVGLVEVLLKAGADPNIRSKLGSTALGQAEQAQREQVVGMLTEAGAVRAVGIDLAALMETFLGRQYKRLTERLPDVKILGGCCGTDHRHIEEICMACVSE